MIRMKWQLSTTGIFFALLLLSGGAQSGRSDGSLAQNRDATAMLLPSQPIQSLKRNPLVLDKLQQGQRHAQSSCNDVQFALELCVTTSCASCYNNAFNSISSNYNSITCRLLQNEICDFVQNDCTMCRDCRDQGLAYYGCLYNNVPECEDRPFDEDCPTDDCAEETRGYGSCTAQCIICMGSTRQDLFPDDVAAVSCQTLVPGLCTGIYRDCTACSSCTQAAEDYWECSAATCAPFSNCAEAANPPTPPPTTRPTVRPTFPPTTEPTPPPTTRPTVRPTFPPTQEPTNEPTTLSVCEPTKQNMFDCFGLRCAVCLDSAYESVTEEDTVPACNLYQSTMCQAIYEDCDTCQDCTEEAFQYYSCLGNEAHGFCTNFSQCPSVSPPTSTTPSPTLRGSDNNSNPLRTWSPTLETPATIPDFSTEQPTAMATESSSRALLEPTMPPAMESPDIEVPQRSSDASSSGNAAMKGSVIGGVLGVFLLLGGAVFLFYLKGKRVMRRQHDPHEHLTEPRYPYGAPIPAVPVPRAEPVLVTTGQVIAQPNVYSPQYHGKSEWQQQEEEVPELPSDLSYKDQGRPLEWLHERNRLRQVQQAQQQDLPSNLQYKDQGLTLEELQQRNSRNGGQQ